MRGDPFRAAAPPGVPPASDVCAAAPHQHFSQLPLANDPTPSLSKQKWHSLSFSFFFSSTLCLFHFTKGVLAHGRFVF